MISLGCPKNLVDSEVMLGLAQQSGHQLTRDAADADVLVVNTCAFIDKAKQESIDTILEMAELKKTGKCQRLVVTGCMAERYRDELREQIPEIDAVLGTGEVPEIVKAIGGSSSAGSASPGAGAPRDPAYVRILRSNGEPIESRTPNPVTCRPTSTTPTPLASSPRRAITRTSRLPRGATTSARSASFRNCGANIGVVRPNRSCARRRCSPRAASRNYS